MVKGRILPTCLPISSYTFGILNHAEYRSTGILQSEKGTITVDAVDASWKAMIISGTMFWSTSRLIAAHDWTWTSRSNPQIVSQGVSQIRSSDLPKSARTTGDLEKPTEHGWSRVDLIHVQKGILKSRKIGVYILLDIVDLWSIGINP